MTIVDFKYLKITTMTVVAKIDGDVNVDSAFPFLEITHMKKNSSFRKTKKTKVPFCRIPGSIISARNKTYNRGVSSKKRVFKNSITIDMSTSQKNVSLKLSKNTIQMCGITSNEVMIEASDHVIHKLYDAQRMLDYIKSDVDRSKRAVDWVLANTLGDIVDIHRYEEGCEYYNLISAEHSKLFTEFLGGKTAQMFDDIHAINAFEKSIINEKTPYIDSDENVKISVNTPISEEVFDIMRCYISSVDELTDMDKSVCYQLLTLDYLFAKSWQRYTIVLILNYIRHRRITNVEPIKLQTIIIPEAYNDMSLVPEDVDTKLIKFYMNMAPDYNDHVLYSQNLIWTLTADNIINGDVSINSFNKVMVNHNYDLGYRVKRFKLANLINGVNGFTARFDNSINHQVTIELPYKVPEDLIALALTKNKSKKIPCHTILIYESGLVTQSGPNERLNEECYNLFRETINSISSQIFKFNDKKVRKIKYTPVYA